MNPDLTSFGADIGATGVACNIVGFMLKSNPYTPNWIIPLALPIVGAVVMGSLSGFTARNVITGLSAGFGAVGAHQALQQLTNHTKPATQEP
jgi:hypothetical protein